MCLKGKSVLYTSVEEWIRQEAVPFSLNSNEVGEAVSKVVASLAASVEILGFGEALHGGEEILLLRNHLFKSLVQAHGYSAIAIESGLPQARIINDYIAGRGPASYEEIQDKGFSHGFGRLEANHELLDWIKNYNAEKDDSSKIRFYGIDMPLLPVGGHAGPGQVLPFALDYLFSLDEIRGQEFRSRIETLLGQPSDWENSLLWRDQEKSAGCLAAANALRIETENLTTELRIRRPEFVAKNGEDRYQEAL